MYVVYRYSTPTGMLNSMPWDGPQSRASGISTIMMPLAPLMPFSRMTRIHSYRTVPIPVPYTVKYSILYTPCSRARPIALHMTPFPISHAYIPVDCTVLSTNVQLLQLPTWNPRLLCPGPMTILDGKILSTQPGACKHPPTLYSTGFCASHSCSF